MIQVECYNDMQYSGIFTIKETNMPIDIVSWESHGKKYQLCFIYFSQAA